MGKMYPDFPEGLILLLKECYISNSIHCVILFTHPPVLGLSRLRIVRLEQLYVFYVTM